MLHQFSDVGPLVHVKHVRSFDEGLAIVRKVTGVKLRAIFGDRVAAERRCGLALHKKPVSNGADAPNIRLGRDFLIRSNPFLVCIFNLNCFLLGKQALEAVISDSHIQVFV